MFALVVVAFCLTKFMHLKREYDHSLFSSTSSQNSTSLDRLRDRRTSLAAAITILSEITPLPSLIFLMYCCTLVWHFSKNGPFTLLDRKQPYIIVTLPNWEHAYPEMINAQSSATACRIPHMTLCKGGQGQCVTLGTYPTK